MDNNFFERFLPKENKFFMYLSDMANAVLKASTLIVECVEEKDTEKVVSIYKKIKEQENLGDTIQNKIFEELNETFITPFDREDINELSGRIDDINNNINSAAKRIMLYSPKTMPESAIQLAKLVHEAAEWVVKTVGELDTLKANRTTVSEYNQQLHYIENKADDVYEHFLIDLFENEKDPVELLKLKDILQELERATDSAERVGKIIKRMIVKYS